MRHKYPVLTVKKLLKSVSIYGSYRTNKTGVPFFWNTLYTPCHYFSSSINPKAAISFLAFHTVGRLVAIPYKISLGQLKHFCCSQY